MPRKTKSKRKGGKKGGGRKKIGAGGLHYPIRGSGNMGGGGPYYIYKNAEVTQAATTKTVEEPAPPKAYDFSAARFSGAPMTYSFPKKSPTKYSGTPAWQSFTSGTPDTSLSTATPQSQQPAWGGVKVPPSKMKSQSRIEQIRMAAMREAPAAPVWPEQQGKAMPSAPDMSIPSGRPKSLWSNQNAEMAAVDEDLVMMNVAVPEPVPIPDVPQTVQSPASFTIPAVPTGVFQFQAPPLKYTPKEYEPGYAPGDVEHKGSGPTLRTAPALEKRKALDTDMEAQPKKQRMTLPKAPKKPAKKIYKPPEAPEQQFHPAKGAGATPTDDGKEVKFTSDTKPVDTFVEQSNPENLRGGGEVVENRHTPAHELTGTTEVSEGAIAELAPEDVARLNQKYKDNKRKHEVTSLTPEQVAGMNAKYRATRRKNHDYQRPADQLTGTQQVPGNFLGVVPPDFQSGKRKAGEISKTRAELRIENLVSVGKMKPKGQSSKRQKTDGNFL
jgi:hypothetical protein